MNAVKTEAVPITYASPHLLVVDDDRRIRELLRRFLSERGFRVSTAASAAQARTNLGGLVFDLIILDVMMPGESGFDFLTGLRRSSDSVSPVLVNEALVKVYFPNTNPIGRVVSGTFNKSDRIVGVVGDLAEMRLQDGLVPARYYLADALYFVPDVQTLVVRTARSDDDEAILPPDPGPSPLEAVQSREQAQQLVSAIEALPLEQRSAFLLFTYADLPLAQVAQVTGVAVETAKSRLRYARARLKQTLAGERSDHV